MNTQLNLDLGYVEGNRSAPIHDPYWDEIVLSVSTPSVDEGGQLSLLYDDQEEPPNPTTTQTQMLTAPRWKSGSLTSPIWLNT